LISNIKKIANQKSDVRFVKFKITDSQYGQQ